ncbi:S1 RNA-binding domain-containing protein [Streptococcus pneumoniae]|nr:S1 RNA-binding domain-containing protein [Streptococcus pneumoniae]
MIELFSILPEYPLKKDGREIPLHFDQDASLSALLLDEDYYNILVHEKETIQGYSVLSNCGLYFFENLFKPRQLPSTTSKQCFEQPATSFLVCSLIFIEY